MVKKELPKRVFKKGKKPLGKIAKKVREKRLADEASRIIEAPSTWQFPKINRFITELDHVLSRKNLSVVRVFWVAVGCIGAGIFIWELGAFSILYPKVSLLLSERRTIQNDYTTWQTVASRYPLYRDAYFQAAVLAYRLGNKSNEYEYLQKVLAIDPNFELAKELGGK